MGTASSPVGLPHCRTCSLALRTAARSWPVHWKLNGCVSYRSAIRCDPVSLFAFVRRSLPSMTRLSDRREQRRAAEGLPCRGRPLDGDLDAVILDAAVGLLGETGYERMTMDGVAARAKVSKATIYRRWDSKASLVVEAMRSCQFAEIELPVTGDLRAD